MMNKKVGKVHRFHCRCKHACTTKLVLLKILKNENYESGKVKNDKFKRKDLETFPLLRKLKS